MELISTPRVVFLRSLVAEIRHNYAQGRVIVAVDGIGGAGQSEFADGLAEVFREAGADAMRASIGDFHAPRRERYLLGRDSPEGFYQDAFDYRTFRRVLIDPFRMGGSTGFQMKAFDLRRDTASQSSWQSAPDHAVLVLDGIFLNRPQLQSIWNYSIFLEVPWAIAYARLAVEIGVDADPYTLQNARYLGGQERYIADAHPREAASAIVDNTDPDVPVRVFADSC